MTWSEWRFSAKLAWQDPFIRWMTVLNIVVFVATSSFLLWKLVPEGIHTGVLTMHYTIYLGIDDVRAWPWVFSVPGGLAAVLLINSFLSFGLFRSEALAARALTGLATAVLIIGAVSSFFLVLINL